MSFSRTGAAPDCSHRCDGYKFSSSLPRLEDPLLSHIWTRTAAGASAVALAVGLTANAEAAGLIPGQCYPKADAETVLKQEGQRPFMIGSRITEKRNVNVFFVNDAGYGYNIEGDQPQGIPSRVVCVSAAYKDAHFNSIQNKDVPEWGKKIKVTGNGIDVQKAYANGGRLIFAGQTYTPKADGTEVPGKYIVVMASTADKGANVWSVDSLGRADGSFAMVDAGFTDTYVEKLQTNPQ